MSISYQERYNQDLEFRRFINGIENHNLSIKTIEESGFYYAGGRIYMRDDGIITNERHAKYWDLRYGNKERPEYKDECICGKYIQNNCYITDDDNLFLIIGNCCIKKFIPKDKQGRTCGICKSPHRNRKDNFCNNCRGTQAGGLCPRYVPRFRKP
jgi:hypothetical protein